MDATLSDKLLSVLLLVAAPIMLCADKTITTVFSSCGVLREYNAGLCRFGVKTSDSGDAGATPATPSGELLKFAQPGQLL